MRDSQVTASEAPRAQSGMRWLALVSDAFGGNGGIAQYNRDLLSALAASGRIQSIRVLPRRATEPVQVPPGIRQLQPRGRAGYALSAVAAALGGKLDVVFCGHIHFAPLASALAALRNAKLVIQAHGIEAWECPRNGWRSAIEKSDIVLSVSRYTRSAVLRFCALPPERIIVLPNTVRDIFTPGDAAAFRREHGVENRRILLTVGRMDSRERYKGQDRVIAALPGLVNGGLDVVYLIAGEGDDRARLEQLACDAWVRERVFVLGPLKPERLVEAYRAADLFVMPSTGEGFGISFVEAMACGTPALGLAARGAVDALVDGHVGSVVTEDNLAGALSRMLAGPKAGGEELAAEVRRRFGRIVFQERVNALVGRLGENPVAVETCAMQSA